MRLGRTVTVAAAVVIMLACVGTARAYEFAPTWGYAYIDDHPFQDPSGASLPATQAWPRGRIRDTVSDGAGVRLTVRFFFAGSQYSVDEGSHAYVPIDRHFSAASAEVSHVRYQFCRLNAATQETFECLPFHRIYRPSPPVPAPPAPAPPVDRDEDGSSPPADCWDTNAAVRPGAREVPGNGVDDDCADGDQPARITATVSREFRASREGTRVLRLRVSDAPTGARVTVRCLGKRCRLKRRTATVRANGAVNLRPLVRRRLRPRTTLEIRIVAPNSIGKVVRYRIRRGRIPPGQTLCLPPGARRPTRC
jgi:Putative metal-binding motif